MRCVYARYRRVLNGRGVVSPKWNDYPSYAHSAHLTPHFLIHYKSLPSLFINLQQLFAFKVADQFLFSATAFFSLSLCAMHSVLAI